MFCTFQVSVFERNNEILREGTANSVLRLHLGLHYPRDIETAVQSVHGYKRFLDQYQDFVNLSFENYYAISKVDSKVDVTHFENFSKQVGIELQPVSPKELDLTGFDHEKVAAIWRCEEGVIDIDSLRDFYQEILANSVDLRTSTEIVEIVSTKSQWETIDSKGNREIFDYIVQATYGTDRITISPAPERLRQYEYHKTFAVEVRASFEKIGLTVIDGDFITILPKGFEETLLIYGPNPSVLEKHVGSQYPTEWDAANRFDFDDATQNLLTRFYEWFPSAEIFEVANILTTVRSIQPNMQTSDKRVSSVQQIAPNFFNIWSGKIDHCVDIANSIVTKIRTTDV